MPVSVGFRMRVIVTRMSMFIGVHTRMCSLVYVSAVPLFLSYLFFHLSFFLSYRISIQQPRIAARICRYNANKPHEHAAHMFRA